MSAPWRVGRVCAQNAFKILTVPRNQLTCRFSTGVFPWQPVNQSAGTVTGKLCPTIPQIQTARYAHGFFTKVTADHLWLGVSSVSNAGKKKGRGRAVGRKKITDLNRGQKLGDGRDTMLWPGLNAPVIKNRVVLKHQQLPTDTTRFARLVEMREKMSQVRYPATPTLLRGYTGGRMVGMRYGPPDPIGDYVFEGFDSVLLEMRHVSNMTGTLGRKMHYTAFVVVGNGKGIIGCGYGKGTRVGNAIKVAKNRAAQALCYVPMFDDHTVYHNMFSQYHKSKLFIHKKPKGYGLKCHRAIVRMCRMIGITDLHCKVEGSTTNVKAIAKGFLNALVDQETHQALADRTGYHVVERRVECDNLPVLVASPDDNQVKQLPCNEDDENITFDLDRMYLNGKVEYKRKPVNPFAKRISYRKGAAIRHKRRNQHDLQLLRLAGLIS